MEKKQESKHGFEPQNIKNGQTSKKVFSFKSKMKLKSWVSSHKQRGLGSGVGPLKQRGGQRREGISNELGCYTLLWLFTRLMEMR